MLPADPMLSFSPNVLPTLVQLSHTSLAAALADSRSSVPSLAVGLALQAWMPRSATSDGQTAPRPTSPR